MATFASLLLLNRIVCRSFRYDRWTRLFYSCTFNGAGEKHTGCCSAFFKPVKQLAYASWQIRAKRHANRYCSCINLSVYFKESRWKQIACTCQPATCGSGSDLTAVARRVGWLILLIFYVTYSFWWSGLMKKFWNHIQICIRHSIRLNHPCY